jgi:putative Mg2+ transporter-C (MgtC) family protein
VQGVATAASIWNTGVVGASVAQDRYLLAAMLAIMNFFTLRFLFDLKKKLDEEKDKKAEISQK